MVPLHPAIVHVPLGLAVAIPAVLLALTVALLRRKVTPRAFLLAALLQVFVVGGGLLALASGEADESRVEAIVTKGALDRHEDLAKVFVGIAAASLAITIVTSLTRKERLARGLAALSTGASAVVLALGLAVGHAGGSLVYRDGAASAHAAQGAQPTARPAGEREHRH